VREGVRGSWKREGRRDELRISTPVGNFPLVWVKAIVDIQVKGKLPTGVDIPSSSPPPPSKFPCTCTRVIKCSTEQQYV